MDLFGKKRISRLETKVLILNEQINTLISQIQLLKDDYDDLTDSLNQTDSIVIKMFNIIKEAHEEINDRKEKKVKKDKVKQPNKPNK